MNQFSSNLTLPLTFPLSASVSSFSNMRYLSNQSIPRNYGVHGGRFPELNNLNNIRKIVLRYRARFGEIF